MHLQIRYVLPVLLALAAAAPGFAFDEDGTGSPADLPPVPDWQSVLEEINDVKAENRRLAEEIDELKAADSDRWLTEKRAEEIKALVADVLADADTRASNLQGGLTAGWNDHFFLASPDGRFKLEFLGQMQFRWIYNYHDQIDRHVNGFEITRAKLTLRGHVFTKDLEYLLRTDATRNEPGLVNGLYFVRDAWVRYHLNDTASVRVGQFKLPFNREELVSSEYQLAVERSLVNESMNLGRSQGIELVLAGEKSKFMFAYSDGATDSLGGFGNVAGSNPVNTEWSVPGVEWSFTARHEWLLDGGWRQFRQMTGLPGGDNGFLIGLAGHAQRTESNGSPGSRRDETSWAAGAVDLSWQWDGANIMAAFTYHYVDNPNFGSFQAYGLVVQGGFYVAPKVELYARYEWGGWSANFDVTTLNVVTAGVNYYIDGQDVKFTADLGIGIDRVDIFWDSDIAGYRIDGPGADPQIVFRTQLQLLF